MLLTLEKDDRLGDHPSGIALENIQVLDTREKLAVVDTGTIKDELGVIPVIEM